jgi:F-type H+-transporting ATPase subunit gamma
MASLKEIRTRISSVISTRQITSAMKMVSAAKLRKAQDAILLMRPYATKLQEIQWKIADKNTGDSENEFTAHKEINRVLLVAISSNKGLCGAFNANVAKKVIQLLEDDYKSEYSRGNVDVICVGKKASEILRSKKIKVAKDHNELFEKISFDKVALLADAIMDDYRTGKYDSVSIIYNQFKNAAVQELSVDLLLPIQSNPVEPSSADTKTDYILEPSSEYITNVLIPKLIRIQLFKALLDSNASEHGARMTAMHKATDNATELIKQLNLDYNKARQASITNEILEIVAGAEAQSG